MQFKIPSTKAGFEIPNDWWAFAEMDSFSPSPGGYYPYEWRHLGDKIELVSLSEIEPPIRSAGVQLFKKYKMMPVLFAFNSPECALPPVEVARSPSNAPFKFKVLNGFHRYYASIAAGYSYLPIVERNPEI